MQLKVVLFICALLMAQTAHAQAVGTMDYDTAANRFKYYDGSTWVMMGGGALSLSLGACTKAGVIEYDQILGLMKFCNGTNWKTFEIGITINICTRAGEWRYNTSANKYEYCNGLLWIRMS